MRLRRLVRADGFRGWPGGERGSERRILKRASMLHVRRIPLQQGREAGMVAEGEGVLSKTSEQVQVIGDQQTLNVPK